ncbi:MAG TPA: ubiquinone biosynthesis regulatory protein kinase UbiB [Gammaproteobacteria bacterium]|nr:ubiquinone biosynthesis regulatory protein kinase UbiB [Gammaproteobacteria bacterium]
MIGPRQVLRFARINWVLVRYGLDGLILGAPWLRPLRFLRYLRPWALFQVRHESAPVRVRKALEDLGPIWVKLGQMLSTRADILPPAYAAELVKLQDQVAPFSGRVARRRLEARFGRSIDALFASFDETPLASASIAQVHAARLPSGEEVVVKVLRPNVGRVIDADLSLMYLFAALAERYLSEARRLHIREVIAQYDRTIHDELDLVREGSNAAQLQRNFEDSPLLHIPKVYWEYTRSDVLVLERIGGIPIDDLAALRAAGVNLERLATNGVEVFFTQVFRHNFFHADMHPGNLFVNASDSEFPVYIAVDFGICGTLAPEDQRYLVENFLAFFNRDYDKVAALHVESGWIPKGTPVNEFAAAIRTVCEPIFNRPLKQISFAQLLVRLFQTARRFDMEIQPQLTLLQKALLHIESLGRMVYPELDVWATGRPFLEEWMRERVGPRGIWNTIKQELPDLGPILIETPKLLHTALTELLDGDLEEMGRKMTKHLRDEVVAERIARRRGHAGAALVIAGALLLGLSWQPSWAAWTIGACGLALVLFPTFRHG